MPFDFYINAKDNGMNMLPDEYYREMQQSFYDSQWDNSSAVKEIEEQDFIGSKTFHKIEAWINKVIGTTTTFAKNGEDYRQLIFRNIDKKNIRGIYYKFYDNIWIADFQNPSEGLVSDTTVRRCNNALRMIDPDNGSIFSIPCVIDYDMTSPSQQTSSYIITPNNHAIVYVQANEDTLRLFKLNTRFMLNGRPFKLLAYQNALYQDINTPKPTVLYLDLYLDEIHAQDNIEKQLAYNGDWNYQLVTSYETLNVLENEEGKIDISVLLNDSPIEGKNIKYKSLNPNIVQIDKDGNYNAVGKIGEATTIIAWLDGNKEVNIQVQFNIQESIQNDPIIIIEPYYEKIRQYETIELEVKVKYGNEIIIPSDISIELNNETSKYLTCSIENSKLRLTCLKISQNEQEFTININNQDPQFNISQLYKIKCVSLMG